MTSTYVSFYLFVFLPQHFLFSTKDETSPLKAVGVGFSAYVKPGQRCVNNDPIKPISILCLTMFWNSADERLSDIVGSSLHVAPEVLHRAYGTESDMWMVGVMTYVLLSGSRPFWAPTEYELFRAVLKTEPSFEEAPWPSLSPDVVDFVKRLLHKDYRKRLTAAQALCKFIAPDYLHMNMLHVTNRLFLFLRSSMASWLSWSEDTMWYDHIQACESVHSVNFTEKVSFSGELDSKKL